jgi:hypothetical protein
MVNPNGAPITDRTRQQVFLMLALLVFYCLPPMAFFVVFIYQIVATDANQIDESKALTALKTLAADPGAYSNIINQMIMPVVAVMTAANPNTRRLKGLSAWIFLLPLIAIFACLLNALLVNSFAATSAINAAQGKIISQYFVSVASNLAVYVMLFVGLKMGENT